MPNSGEQLRCRKVWTDSVKTKIGLSPVWTGL